MTSLNTSSATPSQLSAMLPLRDSASGAKPPRLSGDNSADVRKHFTQFVGEAFYGQMLKAMRSTVGKPAYFHGGRAEEVFQGQLDQKMVEHLTETTADTFAEPLFERQFPNLAKKGGESGLNQLEVLRRN